MKKNSLLIWMFVLVAALPVALGADAGKDPSVLKSEQRKQQAKAIEKDIDGMRKRAEARYARQIEELRRQTAEQIEQFEKTERANLAKAALKTTAIFRNVVGSAQPGYTLNKDGLWVSDAQAAEMGKRIEAKKSELQKNLEVEIARIEKVRQRAVTVGLTDLKKRLEADLLRPRPTETVGMVSGIVYGRQKKSALINREIVHEGDIIYGVKVVRIDRKKVAFQKGDSKWDQTVGGIPETFWLPPAAK